MDASQVNLVTVTVTEAGSGRYAQIVTNGRHTMAADEPLSSGGMDTGPSPYEFLMAGLGACTAITLRAYAERHAWPLRQAVVELRHDKISAAHGPAVDHFYRTIHLLGDLADAQRLRLLQMAELCSVSQTLRRAAVVEARLAEVSRET